VVNGPGEAMNSDIGVTGGGKNTNMIYLSGVADHKISNSEIVDHVVQLVEEKICVLND
jgi:(E)-4-hydroxy-3-methylbut-2-enyl-diphosphate synthase